MKFEYYFYLKKNLSQCCTKWGNLFNYNQFTEVHHIYIKELGCFMYLTSPSGNISIVWLFTTFGCWLYFWENTIAHWPIKGINLYIVIYNIIYIYILLLLSKYINMKCHTLSWWSNLAGKGDLKDKMWRNLVS